MLDNPDVVTEPLHSSNPNEGIPINVVCNPGRTSLEERNIVVELERRRIVEQELDLVNKPRIVSWDAERVFLSRISMTISHNENNLSFCLQM